MKIFKSKIFYIIVVTLIVTAIASITYFVSADEKVPPFKETVLKDSYTSEQELNADLKKSGEKFREYMDKYQDKMTLAEQDRAWEILGKRQQEVADNSPKAFPPSYEKSLNNLKGRLEMYYEPHKVYLSITEKNIQIFYTQYFIDLLEKDPENWNHYFSYSNWGFEKAILTYLEEKGTEKAEIDTEYATSIIDEIIAFSIEVDKVTNSVIESNENYKNLMENKTDIEIENLHNVVAEQIWNYGNKEITEENVNCIISQFI